MRTTTRILAALLSVAAVLSVSLPPAVASGAVAVTNHNDSGPGSLRQAIADAAPGDLVQVPAGTYMLSSGELVVAKDLTIAGAGSGVTVIDAQTASRVIHTEGAGNQVTISGVTIRNGKAVPAPGTTEAEGGGVLNDQATLTLTDDLITGNTAFADTLGRDRSGGNADGGGVFSNGRLNLVRTDIRGNSATAVGGDSHAGGRASGGGAEALGSVDIRSSTFDENLADARGGQGDVNPNQTGGVAGGGGLSVSQSGPAATVSATTFTRNEADGSSGPGSSTGTAFGGGASLEDNTARISQTNVTYNANLALALAGQTFGGGVVFQGDQGQSLTNATLSGNTATAGTSNRGGNIYVSVDETVAIENTIVKAGAADPGSPNCSVVEGTLSSLGHNIESGQDCKFNAPGDLADTAPLLAALTDNGGPVQTIALHTGSPAINAGAARACPSTDARGVLRPAGTACDIGAFEVATPRASTARASAIATSSAVLNGTASNPDLVKGSAFFQYGNTTAYGSTTPAQRIGAVTSQAHLSGPVARLSPSTRYHFRFVVTNATGSVRGSDQTFTTTAAAPGHGTTTPPRVPRATAPRITALKITPTAVAPRRGATITYTDNAASRTTFRFQRRLKGRAQGRSCVSQTATNRHHRTCTRWVTLGRSFTHNDIRGSQRFRLPSHTIAHQPAGRYRLAATPHAGGLTGHTATVGFRLVLP